MTVEPPPDYREEVDIVRIDPLFLERQRNRYASRGVAFLVILNGIAALILLSNFLRLHPQVGNAPKVAAAMVVFGAGVAAALASMFFAYLRRTVRLWAPERAPAAPIGWWLALIAAVLSAVCFVAGLRMVGTAIAPTLVTAAKVSQTPVKGEQGPQGLPGPAGSSGTQRVRKAIPDHRARRANRDPKATWRKRREGRSWTTWSCRTRRASWSKLITVRSAAVVSRIIPKRTEGLCNRRAFR